MAILSSPIRLVVDRALDRHNVPEWARPYIYKYAKRNKLSAIKFAISLVDTGRKKGEVAKDHVRLPNGVRLRIGTVIRLLNVFFHGEEEIAGIEEWWAANHTIGNPEYEARFADLAISDRKHARAVRNLIEGLNGSISDREDSIEQLFGRIRRIEAWEERVVASGLILDYSLMRSLGPVFFRSFYPTAPEFMRNFGKAFTGKRKPARWDTIEAERLIKSGGISHERAMALSRELLVLVYGAIDANMSIAREMGMEEEIGLLKEIAIAYPLNRMRELGVAVDIERETEGIIRLARAGEAKRTAGRPFGGKTAIGYK